MATVTFDTLELAEKLKEAGFAADQAEAVIRVLAKAQDELVTKRDLQLQLAPIKTDLAILKLMLGVSVAGIVALVLRAFAF